MDSTTSCRVTLVGPDRRADVAVPMTMPVVELMPQLVGFVVTGEGAETAAEPAGWTVQRLGEPPFGAAATPRSADWLDGEILYVRPVDQPLPELDFDDVADAIGTSVDRQSDRWSHLAQRRMFTALAVFGVLGAFVVSARLPPPADASASVLLVALIVAWAVRAARTGADETLLGWAEVVACSGCLLAGLEVVRGLRAAPSSPLTESGVVAAVVVAGLIALVLLAFRATPVAPRLPFVPPATFAFVAGGVAAAALLQRVSGMRLADAAAVLVVLLMVVVLLAPRFAARAAGIRVPQLPRSAAEMHIDVEPLAADDVVRRAERADRYLTAGVVAASILLVPAIWLVAHRQGWLALLLAAVFTALAAMRTREVFSVQQRAAVTAAAVAGLVSVVDAVLAGAGPLREAFIISLLIGSAAAAAATARRPQGRRLRPQWRQFVMVLEGVLAASCIPLLLGIIGVYAWARGLAG